MRLDGSNWNVESSTSEVTGEALLQFVEELREMAVVEAAVVHDDVRGERRQLWPGWRHEGRCEPLGRGRCVL